MSSAADRAAAAVARLGAVLAAGIVEEVSRLMSEAPPGGVWGRTMLVPGVLRAEWWEATKAAVERILFEHPSWRVTGGSASWGDPAGLVEAAPGHVAYVLVLTWPRVEDSPLVKGSGDRPARGLLFSPDVLPPLDLPPGVAGGEGWRRP